MAAKKTPAKNKKIYPIRLPGKGKIDPREIRRVVEEVRDRRLAREQKPAAAP